MSETIVTARREASLATYTLTPPHSPMLKGLEKQQKKREKKQSLTTLPLQKAKEETKETKVHYAFSAS